MGNLAKGNSGRNKQQHTKRGETYGTTCHKRYCQDFPGNSQQAPTATPGRRQPYKYNTPQERVTTQFLENSLSGSNSRPPSEKGDTHSTTDSTTGSTTNNGVGWVGGGWAEKITGVSAKSKKRSGATVGTPRQSEDL